MNAFTTTLLSLTYGVCGGLMGIFINKCFVGITSKNLKNMYLLAIIMIAFDIYVLALVRLIPLKKDIEEYTQLKADKLNNPDEDLQN